MDSISALSTLWQSTAFRLVGGIISLVAGPLVIYNRWNNAGIQRINLKKTRLDILESMLKQIEAGKNSYNLLIEYQFEIIFRMSYSAEEIKSLVRLPHPIRMVTLRIKSGSNIEYRNSAFFLTMPEQRLKIVITTFDILYWISSLVLFISYLLLLTTDKIDMLVTMIIPIPLLAIWKVYSTEYYSSKLFCQAYKGEHPDPTKPTHNAKKNKFAEALMKVKKQIPSRANVKHK